MLWFSKRACKSFKITLWSDFISRTEEKYRWLAANPAYTSWKHEEDKVIVFERADCLFIFNFHCQKSFTDYKVGVHFPGTYKIILDTDASDFGGFNRLDHSTEFKTLGDGYAGRENALMVYVPARSAFVLARNWRGVCTVWPVYTILILCLEMVYDLREMYLIMFNFRFIDFIYSIVKRVSLVKRLEFTFPALRKSF